MTDSGAASATADTPSDGGSSLWSAVLTWSALATRRGRRGRMGRQRRRLGAQPQPAQAARPRAAVGGIRQRRQLLGYISSDMLRTSVAGRQIPRLLREATVAIEDRRFYQHGGIDYQGILRAGVQGRVRRRQQHPGRLDADDAAGRQRLPARTSSPTPRSSSTRSSRPSSPRSWRRSTPRAGSSPSTSTTSPTERSAVRPRSASAPPRRCSSTSRCRSSTSPRRRCSPACRRRPRTTTRSSIRRSRASRRHEVLQAMVQSHYITRAQADAADASPLEVQRNNAYGAQARALRLRLRQGSS